MLRTLSSLSRNAAISAGMAVGLIGRPNHARAEAADGAGRVVLLLQHLEQRRHGRLADRCEGSSRLMLVEPVAPGQDREQGAIAGVASDPSTASSGPPDCEPPRPDLRAI